MFWNCVLKGPLKYVLLMKLHAVILVTVNLLWEAHNAGLDSLGYSFFFSFSFPVHRRGVCTQLAAQGLPGDTAEEGMTLDVAHPSTATPQTIACVKLK